MSNELIYHYTNFDAATSIIENKNIRLSSSLGMDDQTDRFFANLYATIFILTSKDRGTTKLRTHIDYDDMVSANIESLKIPFYSTSFCERLDNEYLWENYADKHAGVCIAFSKNYLLEQIRNVLLHNYVPLDLDEIAGEHIRDFVPIRSVYYKKAEEFLIDVVHKTRPTDKNYTDNSPFAYKHWLERVFSVVAGVIKADEFKPEEEVRLLFQDTYKDEYIVNHPMYAFDCARFKDGFSKLGLCELKSGTGKQYYELRLEKFFNSELIPKIVLGKNSSDENIELLKKTLYSNRLTHTVVDESFISTKALTTV